MNTKKGITADDVRLLLNGWYNGTTDILQEDVLFVYFIETPDSEVPEDLRDDAKLFRLLSLRKSSCPDVELLRKIDNEIRYEKLNLRKKKILRWSAWFSSAACIAALVFGIFRMDKGADRREITLHEKSLASVLSINETPHTPIVSTSGKNTNHIAFNSTSPEGDKRKPNKMREITDVNEAVAIMASIDRRLEKTLSKGFDAFNNVQADLIKSNEITNRVLKNIKI